MFNLAQQMFNLEQQVFNFNAANVYLLLLFDVRLIIIDVYITDN